MSVRPSIFAAFAIFFCLAAPSVKASSRFHFKSNIKGVSVIDARITPAPQATDYDQYRIAIEVKNTTEDRIIELDSQVCYGTDVKGCQQIYFGKHFWPGTTNWSETAQLKNYENQPNVTVVLSRIQTIGESDDASVESERVFCPTAF